MIHMVKYHHLVNIYLSDCYKSPNSSHWYRYWHQNLKNNIFFLWFGDIFFRYPVYCSFHIFQCAYLALCASYSVWIVQCMCVSYNACLYLTVFVCILKWAAYKSIAFSIKCKIINNGFIHSPIMVLWANNSLSGLRYMST